MYNFLEDSQYILSITVDNRYSDLMKFLFTTGLLFVCSVYFWCYIKNKKHKDSSASEEINKSTILTDNGTSSSKSTDQKFSKVRSQVNQRDTDELEKESSRILYEITQRDFKEVDEQESSRIREVYKITPLDIKEADELISTLYDKSKGGKKSRVVTRNEFVHQLSGISVTSWKMNEWDYKKHRTPTQARGLFTREVENNRREIVVRGYNKFFNTDEVSETKWENIFTRTEGPYEVTVKENGCIIFISGLPGNTIIVTSKHSMGERENGLAHAVVGEQWLDKHLAKAGKSKQDLARFLYRYRLTAVAELCDDQFEEHVLPYALDRRGLYLHGINLNTVDLRTWPSNMVVDFAKEWGFNKVDYYTIQTAEEVKIFTDEIQKKGSLGDRPIEGVVIRTKIIPTGQDFFFKVKCDEPYLMYREWREITKTLLSNKKPRVTYTLSQHYLKWVREKIQTQPELFEEFKQNHGIFDVRERFLEYWNNNKGAQTFAKIPQKVRKILLVPVATVGCGKTTLSLALENLFSFGHIQNDNVEGRKKFYRNINKAFDRHDVVIADRNNHLIELRKTLIDDVKKNLSDVHIIAIYWDHDRTPDEIFQITSERIVARGENHQSLTPGNPNYENVIWNFIRGFEHLNSNNRVDNQFEDVIHLDIASDIKTNLEIVIKELNSIIEIKIPSEDAINDTLEKINHYKPTVRKVVGKVIYYGISLDFNIKDFLTKYYSDRPDENPEIFKKLVQGNRISQTHHVTLIHSTELKKDPSVDKQSLWEQCEELCKNSPQAKVHFDKIVFNPQIIALVANRIDPSTIRSTSKIIHATVGTVDDSVKPFQANTICELALLGSHEENVESNISVVNLEQGLVVNGTIKAFRSN